MTFEKDLKLGKRGERAVARWFNGKGWHVGDLHDGKGFDLVVTSPDPFNETFKVECKLDLKTHLTGNVVIEYMSRDKPSGISTTESRWWFYLTFGNVYVFNPFVLRRLVLEPFFHDVVVTTVGGDDNTSKLFLFPEWLLGEWSERVIHSSEFINKEGGQ